MASTVHHYTSTIKIFKKIDFFLNKYFFRMSELISCIEEFAESQDTLALDHQHNVIDKIFYAQYINLQNEKNKISTRLSDYFQESNEKITDEKFIEDVSTAYAMK